MTDKELLEAAAKAAQMDPRMRFCEAWDGMAIYTPQDGYFGPTWNPLADDGDALRLAVKLELQITLWDKYARVWLGEVEALEDYNGDRNAATRRAIVRAAAQMANAELTGARSASERGTSDFE